MLGVQPDRWDTAGGVFKAGMGLARTGLDRPAVLRPPRPIGGPMWMVRGRGLGYVMTVVYRAVGALLIISVTSAAASQWWTGRQSPGVVVGQHR